MSAVRICLGPTIHCVLSQSRPYRHRQGLHPSPRIPGGRRPQAVPVNQNQTGPAVRGLDQGDQPQPWSDRRHVRLQALQGGVQILGHAVQDRALHTRRR